MDNLLKIQSEKIDILVDYKNDILHVRQRMSENEEWGEWVKEELNPQTKKLAEIISQGFTNLHVVFLLIFVVVVNI